MATEHKSEVVVTKDTPYLTLMGELWCIHYEDFWENWDIIIDYTITTL